MEEKDLQSSAVEVRTAEEHKAKAAEPLNEKQVETLFAWIVISKEGSRRLIEDGYHVEEQKGWLDALEHVELWIKMIRDMHPDGCIVGEGQGEAESHA